jgi:hypothetical protein
MSYSYVLLSGRDGKFYIGSTGDQRSKSWNGRSRLAISLPYMPYFFALSAFL